MSTKYTDEQRTDFARAIMGIFHDWGIEPKDQATLLGLPAETKPRAMTRFRQGTPLPDDDQMMDRVGKFLAMQNSLDTTFPHNQSMANYWVTTPNPRFGDQTPLELMLNQGADGIDTVVRYLDASEDWW